MATCSLSFSGMLACILGSSLLRTLLKWSFHLCIRSAMSEMTFPSKSFTAISLFFTVIWLSCAGWPYPFYVLLLRLHHFVSAHKSLRECFLICFGFFFISRSRAEYLVCSGSFKRCGLALCTFFFTFLPLSIVSQVSNEIQSSFFRQEPKTFLLASVIA